MPELDCPLGDYTASKPSEAEAALDLAGHLIAAHCKTPGRKMDVDSELVQQIVIEGVEARVGTGFGAGLRSGGE